MSKISIAKALKLKGKYVKKIQESYTRMVQSNSYVEGAKISYDALAQYELWLSNTEKLTKLKTAIHLANASIYNKIFEMAESKNMISRLQGLPCQEGPVNSTNWRNSETTTTNMVCSISEIERDNMILGLEITIERLQDELEAHNATTMIDVSFLN